MMAVKQARTVRRVRAAYARVRWLEWAPPPPVWLEWAPPTPMWWGCVLLPYKW